MASITMLLDDSLAARVMLDDSLASTWCNDPPQPESLRCSLAPASRPLVITYLYFSPQFVSLARFVARSLDIWLIMIYLIY